MAKKSKVQINIRRIGLVQKLGPKRQELRKQIKKDGNEEAKIKLQKMPRNSSYIRIRNRDALDGRPRGYIGRFAISRVNLRKLYHEGKIPGMKKAGF